MGTWLKRLAILALLGFPAAVIGKRLGLFDFGAAFGMISATLLVALLVFVLGLLFALVQRNSNPESAGNARKAVLLSLLPLIGIGSQVMVGGSVPKIHNITTDTIDPPQFDAVVALRGTSSNPLEYDAATLAPQQQQAYPDLATLVVKTDLAQAHTRALKVVEDLGWELVASQPERGLIEATETTALWDFKDDVVIRLTPVGDSVEVDLRSVSRIGQSDLGANAKRISKFLAAYQDQ